MLQLTSKRPRNWFVLLILPWEVPQSTNMWRKAEVHSQNTFCMRLSWLTKCNACFPMGVFSLQHRACLCYQILKAHGSTGKTCCKLCSQQRRKQGVFGSSSPLLSTVLALANLVPLPAAGAQQNCLGFTMGTIFLQAARQAHHLSLHHHLHACRTGVVLPILCTLASLSLSND